MVFALTTPFPQPPPDAKLASSKSFLLSYIQEKAAILPFGKLRVNRSPKNGSAGWRSFRVALRTEVE